MGRVTTKRRIVKIAGDASSARGDTVVTEEPLEIRLHGSALAVTMRTPGDDFDLAAGFLVSEGVIWAREHLRAIRYCAGATADGPNTYNVLDVATSPQVVIPDFTLERSFYTTSSCGLCGKASLDAVRTKVQWPATEQSFALDPALLSVLPDRLRAAQRLFERTGGLHAAGLFTPDGHLQCVREDVGRHNAVDKLVGWALREDRLPLRQTILLVSGRASFELVQKAAMAGIPAMAAVSAPSSLAVELADELDLTLVGFLRGSTMNVYAGAHRISLRSSA
jgi:FdhD protein